MGAGDTEQAGRAFVEVTGVVREWLVEATPRDALVHSAPDARSRGSRLRLGIDPSGDPCRRLALESADRQAFEESIQHEEEQVGHHMTREWVMVPRQHHPTGDRGAPPARRASSADRSRVRGGRASRISRLDPLPTLLVKDPSSLISSAVAQDTVTFELTEHVLQAVKAFERYDLVSAPVMDDRGKLVGRLTVDTVMDLARDEADLRALKRAGLTRDEDLFAGPWDSARNRWPWLAVNLVTAFAASRVIGRFEGAISGLSALATLMPIVASIGGNTGNQTMAIMIARWRWTR